MFYSRITIKVTHNRKPTGKKESKARAGAYSEELNLDS
jgi:hypothetical protein